MTETNRILGRVGLCLLASSALFSQGTQTANVVGNILSREGKPVAKATVRLLSPSIQWPRVCMTSEEGRFIARMLPPGSYIIEVTAVGFQTTTVKQVVGVGQTFAPRIILTEEAPGATVEVVASAPAGERTESRTATNYELAKVETLPTGRSMEALALLTPGITSGVGGRTQIRGAMTSQSLYLMDGQNISDNVYNDRGVRIIDDFIEQVEIIRGALPAEYGNVEGGVLNAVTMSGGNTFTGQVRWALSKPSWNALAPLQSRESVSDTLNTALSTTVGGYIVKDRLWFAAAHYATGVDTPMTLAGTAAGSVIHPYTATTDEARTHLKLTWSPTANHSLIAAYNTARIDDENRAYDAGELAALAPQKSTSTFWNLTWRALWNPAIATEFKYGQKSQELTVLADPAMGSSLYASDLVQSFVFQNAYFSGQTDTRKNRTLDGKLTLLWDGLGQHTTEAGFQLYQGLVHETGVPSPTGVQIVVREVNLATRTAVPEWRSVYTPTPGEAKNESLGFFLSDQWVVNDRFSMTLGLRQDFYRGFDEAGDKTFSTNALSPRVSLKLDPSGNRTWVAGLSWALYNGRPLETIMNRVTHQGSPVRQDSAALSPLALPFAQLDDPSLYGPSTTYDATRSVRLDPSLKPPRVDEVQATLQYGFTIGQATGFLRLTGVQKTWADLLDSRIGNDGFNADGEYLNVWGNSPLATRTYRGLELDGQLSRGAWTLEGNITWSRLRGNYEGESTNIPGKGEGLAYFTVIEGQPIYVSALTNPEGYLQGHVPLRARVMFNFEKKTFLGTSTLGLMFRFDGAATYDKVRILSMQAIEPFFPANWTTTQHLGERGSGRFNAAKYLDLALSLDLPMFKAFKTPVRAYVKATVTNIFNHQQQLNWDTAFAPAATFDAAWTPANATTFGRPRSFMDYGTARSLYLTLGIRF